MTKEELEARVAELEKRLDMVCSCPDECEHGEACQVHGLCHMCLEEEMGRGADKLKARVADLEKTVSWAEGLWHPDPESFVARLEVENVELRSQLVRLEKRAATFVGTMLAWGRAVQAAADNDTVQLSAEQLGTELGMLMGPIEQVSGLHRRVADLELTLGTTEREGHRRWADIQRLEAELERAKAND